MRYCNHREARETKAFKPGKKYCLVNQQRPLSPIQYGAFCFPEKIFFSTLNKKPENPLGIFDSGIGGLTVAHAIRELMPHEHMVYFGDTAHLPYGDKSEAAIQAYSVKIANVLLEKGCKVIVIACHSASSASYELLKEYVRHEAHVINVIDPMVEFVLNKFKEINDWINRHKANNTIRPLFEKNS